MGYVVVVTKTDGTKKLESYEEDTVAVAVLTAAVGDPDIAYAMVFRPAPLDGYLTRIEDATQTVATLLKCKPSEIADRVYRLFDKLDEHDAALKELRAKLKALEPKP